MKSIQHHFAMLKELISELHIPFSQKERELLEMYTSLLLQWNQKTNLTSITNIEDIVIKHFFDSYTVVSVIHSSNYHTLIDVGSGAGFPGAVIALALPSLTVTLLESNHKKIAFLLELQRVLGLNNLKVIADRLENIIKTNGYTYDVAVSRATFPLNKWMAWGKKLTTKHGMVIGMEGKASDSLPPNCIRLPVKFPNGNRSLIIYST